MYDVDSLQVQVEVTGPQLVDSKLPKEARAAAVHVSVAGPPELPQRLRMAVGQRLHREWVAAFVGGASGECGLKLQVPFEAAQRDFVALLGLLPELLESYESVDAAGATVRRIAVIHEDAQVVVDMRVRPEGRHAAEFGAPPHGASPPERLSSAAAAAAPASARARDTCRGPACAPDPRVTALGGVQHEALLRDLAVLQRRYGATALSLLPLLPALPGRVESEGGGTEGLPVARFRLRLTPSDPAWDRRRALVVEGDARAAYPHCGALSVRVVADGRSPAGGLLVAQVLDRLVALEARVAEEEATAQVAEAAARQAGRAPARRPYTGPLVLLAKQLENTAGQLLQQAQELAAQAQQERRVGGARPPSATAERTAAAALATHDPFGFDGWEEQLHGTVAAGSGRGLGDDSADASDSYGSDSEEGSGEDSAGSSGSGGAAAHTGLLEAGGGGGGVCAAERARQRLLLQGLGLDGIDALQALALRVQVACTRCGAASDVVLRADAADGAGRAGVRGEAACAGCCAALSLQYWPALVHERCNALGTLAACGCAAVDLLPSMMAAQCAGCSSMLALRDVQVGRAQQRTCTRCHTSMSVYYGSAQFAAVAPATPAAQQRRASGGGGGGSAAAAMAGYVPQPGQPLPDTGTCRHYQHSHRWLRFPCCGRRYPCDLCHEQASDGHEMRWAVRHVCGYCSTEQPISERCVSCGKKLANTAGAPSGKQTRFWEGGTGCRDPSRMHRNDRAKFRNSKHKSHSRKAERVGEQGAARREARRQRHAAGS